MNERPKSPAASLLDVIDEAFVNGFIEPQLLALALHHLGIDAAPVVEHAGRNAAGHDAEQYEDGEDHRRDRRDHLGEAPESEQEHRMVALLAT